MKSKIALTFLAGFVACAALLVLAAGIGLLQYSPDSTRPGTRRLVQPGVTGPASRDAKVGFIGGSVTAHNKTAENVTGIDGKDV